MTNNNPKVKNSIILKLGVNLELYSLDSVKEKLELLGEIQRENGQLNLSEKFESFWKANFENCLKSSDGIYFFLEETAGFTDTRVVYIWLKSWQMFNSKNQFFVSRLNESLELETLEDLYLKLTKIIQTENLTSDLVYSKEPRIGV